MNRNVQLTIPAQQLTKTDKQRLSSLRSLIDCITRTSISVSNQLNYYSYSKEIKNLCFLEKKAPTAEQINSFKTFFSY
jgi:hypothetical protein